MNQQVRGFWEREACGTAPEITGPLQEFSLDWFQEVERNRYSKEPMIHSVAQFTRHRGKRILEIGVGAGTDHLQWARAGCDCYGVDLTERAVETTRKHLAHYGLTSNLKRVDAESLPFADGTFDLVYSWGVIHHAERPEAIIQEVRRVLKPGGEFVGMMYHRRSVNALRFWLKFGLLKGRPWRSIDDVIAVHMESIGTKCYSIAELAAKFSNFQRCEVWPLLTPYDTARMPAPIARLIPDELGWFLGVRAQH